MCETSPQEKRAATEGSHPFGWLVFTESVKVDHCHRSPWVSTIFIVPGLDGISRMRSIFSGLVVLQVAPADGSLGLFRGRLGVAPAIPFRPSMEVLYRVPALRSVMLVTTVCLRRRAARCRPFSVLKRSCGYRAVSGSSACFSPAKMASISSRVRPFVSGRKKVAVRK